MRIAATILALVIAARPALAAQSPPFPESSYSAFVKAAEEEFPGPFDEGAFRRDHPESAWAAVRDGKVKVEPLTYTVDGLKITGVIVRPLSGRNLPILIWSRGGVGRARLDPPQVVEMGWWARRGYVVVASNFRGAGGSEGEDEFGGADVDDLMALIPIARSLPGVDPKRIYGIGFSRGGMMLLQATGRGMPVKAIATVGAPTDFPSWTAERSDIDDLLKRMTPDYEAEKKVGFCRRSATCWAARLKVPVYIAHGASDRAVPPEQAVLLGKRLAQLKARYRLSIVPAADHGLWGHREQLFAEVHNFFSTAGRSKVKTGKR